MIRPRLQTCRIREFILDPFCGDCLQRDYGSRQELFSRSERAADSLQLRLDRTVELLTGGRKKTSRESDAVAERRLKHVTFRQQELARDMHEEAVHILNGQGLNMPSEFLAKLSCHRT